MSADWPYSQLSKMASNAGGPEEFIKIIKNHALQEGVKIGKAQMLPFIGIAVGVGSLGTYGILKWRERKMSKLCVHPVSAEEAAVAEEILIQQITGVDKVEASDNDIDEPENG